MKKWLGHQTRTGSAVLSFVCSPHSRLELLSGFLLGSRLEIAQIFDGPPLVAATFWPCIHFVIVSTLCLTAIHLCLWRCVFS